MIREIRGEKELERDAARLRAPFVAIHLGEGPHAEARIRGGITVPAKALHPAVGSE